MSGSAAPAALRVVAAKRSIAAAEVLRGVDLHVEAGEIVALLGLSGCGKTTLLRAVAGLDRLDAGEVWLGDRQMAGTGVHVAPEHRGIGMVFQDGVLFPHLDVTRNVGFGLAKGERRRSARIDEVLELVGLSALRDRYPDELSGGEAQRVALARALAPRPAAILFDEPFSNLDAPLRARLRAEVRGIVREAGVTTLFVTHDRDEAFEVGDRLALMRDGRVVQIDEPEQAYRHPADAWAAGVLGDADLLDGELDPEAGVVRCALGVCAIEGGSFGGDSTVGVGVVIRPEDVSIIDDDGDPSRAGVVVGEHFVGATRVASVRLDTGEIVRSRRLSGAPAAQVGQRVGLRWSVPLASVVEM